jgi:hypothetical protein
MDKELAIWNERFRLLGKQSGFTITANCAQPGKGFCHMRMALPLRVPRPLLGLMLCVMSCQATSKVKSACSLLVSSLSS